MKWIKILTFLTIFILVSNASIQANASAGYYPVTKGELLEVEVCLPKSVKSPITFLASRDSKKWKSIQVIRFKKLVKGQCEAGLLKLKYKWKVNLEGEWILHFYDSKTKKTYYPWPDGIVGKVK